MDRCRQCLRPFGLVRKTLGALWWQKSFCGQRCADEHAREHRQRQRVLQFLRYIGKEPMQK